MTTDLKLPLSDRRCTSTLIPNFYRRVAIVFSLSIGCLGAFCQIGDVPAEETAVVVAGERELTWLRITLDPLPDRGPAELLLAHDGEVVRRVMVDDLGIAATNITASMIDTSQKEDDRLAADLVVGHSGLRMNRDMVPPLSARMPLRLELSIKDNAVSGSFLGQWRKNLKSMDRVDVSGKVMGDVVNADDNSVSLNASWPAYLGPNQNFSSGPSSVPIVDDLNQARLIWVSQYIGPTEAGSHRYGACVGVPSAAGGFSPLVAHGRVYQVRYQAAGDVYQKPHIDKLLSGEQAERTRQKIKEVGWTMDDLAKRWRILADEELLCIDASTGRTVWKIRWPMEGLHYFAHKCSLTNWTGAIAGDTVLVLGGTGRLRAVDAHRGRERWAISVPGLAGKMAEMKKKALGMQHFAAPTRNFCHALAVTDDLVLAPDDMGSCGIVGIEIATGKIRWHVSERILPVQTVSPLVIKLPRGPTLVVAVGDSKVTAIDASTGKIAWNSDAVGWNSCQCILAGDRLIAQAMKLPDLEKEYEQFPKAKISQWAPDAVLSAPAEDHGQIGCWQVTASGLKHLWTTPREWGATRFTPVGAVLGEHLCFRGKFAYQIVDLANGKRLAQSYLSAPARMDEGHMLAVPGKFIAHPDTQHGDNKFFPFVDRPNTKVGPLWQPPHPRATTYQVAMSHAWADGRLFIRGADALYCYDLRKRD